MNEVQNIEVKNIGTRMCTYLFQSGPGGSLFPACTLKTLGHVIVHFQNIMVHNKIQSFRFLGIHIDRQVFNSNL